MTNFELWSTIANIILMIASVWLYVASRGEKNRIKAQVKVWMETANGVSQALGRIVQDSNTGLYSSVKDICNAVWVAHSSAFSLYQTLLEERCVTEKEYKERHDRIIKQLDSQNKPK